MASCDWKKIKGAGEAKSMFRHCDEEKRLECEHSNKDIDKTKTHLNLSFGAFEDGYDAASKAYDDFIADLDSQPGANKRKDRVTLVGWSIPAPKGMNETTAREWMSELYSQIADKYGDVLLGGTAHFDEVHEYKNAETGNTEESRPHVHIYVVPVVDGKLNGKQFMSRKNMVQMNNDIEAMTEAHFPGYRFMNGTQKKSTKSVEELKNESSLREAIEQAQIEAEKCSAQIIKDAHKDAEAILSDAKSEANEIRNEANEIRNEANEMRSEASESLREAIEAKRVYEQAGEAVQDFLNSARDERDLTAWAYGKKLKSGKTIYGLYLSDTEVENKRKNEDFNVAEQHAERVRKLEYKFGDMLNQHDESDGLSL